MRTKGGDVGGCADFVLLLGEALLPNLGVNGQDRGVWSPTMIVGDADDAVLLLVVEEHWLFATREGGGVVTFLALFPAIELAGEPRLSTDAPRGGLGGVDCNAAAFLGAAALWLFFLLPNDDDDDRKGRRGR